MLLLLLERQFPRLERGFKFLSIRRGKKDFGKMAKDTFWVPGTSFWVSAGPNAS